MPCLQEKEKFHNNWRSFGDLHRHRYRRRFNPRFRVKERERAETDRRIARHRQPDSLIR